MLVEARVRHVGHINPVDQVRGVRHHNDLHTVAGALVEDEVHELPLVTVVQVRVRLVVGDDHPRRSCTRTGSSCAETRRTMIWPGRPRVASSSWVNRNVPVAA
jgi:hypothetical protein